MSIRGPSGTGPVPGSCMSSWPFSWRRSLLYFYYACTSCEGNVILKVMNLRFRATCARNVNYRVHVYRERCARKDDSRSNMRYQIQISMFQCEYWNFNHTIRFVSSSSVRKRNKNLRSRQDSNLRGHSPSDFESDALTTRPRLLR